MRNSLLLSARALRSKCELAQGPKCPVGAGPKTELNHLGLQRGTRGEALEGGAYENTKAFGQGALL